MKRFLVIGLAALALAACGTTSSTTSSAPASSTTSAASAAGSPSAAAGSPSAAPSPLSATTQHEICTALEAEVITQGTASAVSVESVYGAITYAQVMAAVQAVCPTVANNITP